MTKHDHQTAFLLALLLALLPAGCGGNRQQGTSFETKYERATKITNPETRATELVRLAYQREQAGDELGADRCLTAATTAAEETEDAAGRAKVFNLVAYARGSMGRSGDAKKLLREVRDAVKNIQDPTTRAYAISKMAVIYGQFLDSETAAKSYLEEAVAAAEQIEAPEIEVDALARIAENYYQIKLAEEAEQVVQQARTKADAIADSRRKSDALAEVAARLHRMQRATDAEDAFTAAEQAAGTIDDPLKRAYALVNLATKRIDADNKRQARQLLEEAEAAADQIGDLSMRNPLVDQIFAQRRRL